MNLSLELQQHQQLRITPQLQQALHLLQLSTLEFNQEVEAALSENPFLESGETVGSDSASLIALPAENKITLEAPAPEEVPEAEPEVSDWSPVSANTGWTGRKHRLRCMLACVNSYWSGH